MSLIKRNQKSDLLRLSSDGKEADHGDEKDEWARDSWFTNRRKNILETYNTIPKIWLSRIYFYELFLIIGELDGNPKYGLSDYFELLETRSCTTKTLSTFIANRIADGDLVLVESLKQSRRTYKLNPELRELCARLPLVPVVGLAER
ncbi:MAG: hypothetical protein P8M25_02960 [Paracoccaceae bacterium]|nr:hypothetical protein [Paracoccaceae bacterium]